VWQQGFSPEPFDQAEMSFYCASLTLAGGGWRLPNIDELVSMMDWRFGQPTVDPTFFPGTLVTFFWSSTLGGAAYGDTWAWGAFTDSGVAYVEPRVSGGYARCVR
jgi:hypothetical protein